MTMTTISNDIWCKEPPSRRARLRWPLFGGLRDAIGARRAKQRPDVLDDRMLRDIGLVRSEIEYGARQYKTTEW